VTAIDTHEGMLAAFNEELDLLKPLDLSHEECAAQAFQALSVRVFMAGGRPIRWLFGGGVRQEGTVITMEPNRSEVHSYADDGRDRGTWPTAGTWPSDDDTVRLD
jgi:hypothetical protein